MTDDLLPHFLAEGRELVQQAGDALLALERGDPSGRALLDQAFRAVHTLKGSTGLFDLQPMGVLLHAAEDVLDRLRAAPGTLDAPSLDALLGCLGACEHWLDAIQRTGALPTDAAEDAARLRRSLPGGGDALPARAVSAEPDRPGEAPDWVAPLLDRFAAAVAQARRDGHALCAVRYRPAPDCFFLGDDPVALLHAVPGLAGLHLESALPAGSVPADPFTCVLVATLLSTAPAEALRAAFRTVPDQVEIVAAVAPPEARPDGDGAGARLVRVDAGRIDTVVDLAGEMLVARNALGALVDALPVDGSQAPNPLLRRAFLAAHAEIDRLARALRTQATALRLMPLEHLFRRLPRLVREIAAADGKEVDLELSGGDVELDRAVSDRLFEPLLHVLRNAVGHGIEAPHARAAANKPGRGRLRVRAEAAGGQVVVVVADDGRGIDPGRVRAVARNKALLDPGRLDALDDAGCLDLVFLPGFSTAATVTALSGRGVGMDAVREAVAAVGGRVGLDSRPGEGTEVRISLPRDVSIATVLLINSGGERFAVPIGTIREIVRLPSDRVLAVAGGAAFTLRERVVPLLDLAPLLELDQTQRWPATVLVSDAQGQQTGFAVDAVVGRAELMVRQLDGVLSGTRGVSGTALGPDGRVIIVLDLPELASAEPVTAAPPSERPS